MIVGNGNVASVLSPVDQDGVIFFASGVSDSGCQDMSQFHREEKLLSCQDRNKHLVYFSNLLQYRVEYSLYLQHKRKMEELIKDNFPYYTIVRIEVLEWGRNPTTIHNVFRKLISEGKRCRIDDDVRYVLSKEEFLWWLKLIPLWKKGEMNIPGVRHTIQQIYDRVKAGTL